MLGSQEEYNQDMLSLSRYACRDIYSLQFMYPEMSSLAQNMMYKSWDAQSQDQDIDIVYAYRGAYILCTHIIYINSDIFVCSLNRNV